jgi:ParB family chromosome partitioning protein
LKACQLLGWTEVPVTFVDIDQIARGEIAENGQRKNFTPSEVVAIAATVEARERELARERMTLGKVSPGSERGRTRDKIAAALGISGRSLEKAQQVVAAAERDPERYGCLVETMDRTGNINQPYIELRRG